MLNNGLPSGTERDRESDSIRPARSRRVRRRDRLQQRQRHLSRINAPPHVVHNFPGRTQNPGVHLAAATSNRNNGVDRRIVRSMRRPQRLQRNRQINPRWSPILDEQLNRLEGSVQRLATRTRSPAVRPAPYSYTQAITGPEGDSRLRHADEQRRDHEQRHADEQRREQQRITRARWRRDERDGRLRRVRTIPSLQLRRNTQVAPRARRPRRLFTLNSTSTNPSLP